MRGLLSNLSKAGLLAISVFTITGFGWHAHQRQIGLEVLGSYSSGIFDDSGAEIGAYDARTRRVFVTNAAEKALDILDIIDPSNPVKLDSIQLGGGPNSVATLRGVVAVALEADVKQDPGRIVFYDTDGNFLNEVTVGALPDMLTFTPNGRFLVVANEGEPNDDYTVDPEGAVSIIRMRKDPRRITPRDVRTAGFSAFNDQEIDPAIRIFGPNASVAQDLEPEYITVTADSRQAVVTLQENNALAIVDLKRAKVTELVALGTKDHAAAENALDASNRDDGINIQSWPVRGMYQPDAIASYRYRGKTYLVTVNEGDARDYDGYSEEVRVKDLDLDRTAFPDADYLQQDQNIGRLKTTTASGDTNGDGDVDVIHAFGARSFSIWKMNGEQVFDSGSEFARVIAAQYPEDFNSTNDENGSFDDRSDDKGSEPEALAVGRIGHRTYAFIGLERMGGIMVYDISRPQAPVFVEYVNNRDFSGDPEAGTAGDLGPEGIVFVPAWKSPLRAPLLIVTNEVSGTTTVYKIRR